VSRCHPTRAACWRSLLASLGAAVVASLIATLYLTSSSAGAGYAVGGFPLDDAWIHMVYARSIAQGQPFQYNPGEWETGSTSPLWALLIAPALALGASPVATGKALGVLLMAAAAATGFQIASRIGHRRAGLAFALCLPLVPYLSFASVSGTEVPLFLFLLLLTFDVALAGRWTWAGVGAGFAILARPEGFLLLPLLAIALAVEHAATRRRRDDLREGIPVKRVPLRLLREGIRPLLAALLVVSPWALYCLWASGRPLPATFYVKSVWLGFLNLEQFKRIGSFLFTQPFAGLGFGTTPTRTLAAGLGAAIFGAGLYRLGRSSATALILIGLFSPVFYYALSTELPLGRILGPDQPGSVANFYYARYLLPGLAPYLLTCLLGTCQVDEWVTSRTARAYPPAQGAARLVLALALFGLPVASVIAQQGVLRDVYSWNCQNIEELEVAAAKWIAANVPAGATLAVSDAGAARYFGEHRIVDLVGLNSHRLVPLLRAINQTEKGGAEESRLRERFWREEPADYVAVLSGWHLRLLTGRRLVALKSFTLPRNTVCGGSQLVVARMEPRR